MLKQEAALTLGLLVAHDGLCLIHDGGGSAAAAAWEAISGTVISVSASLGTLPVCARSSSPAAAAQDFADVPPRVGSCSSQPPGFHLPGGLAPPGCDGAAPFPSPSFHKDRAVAVRGRGILPCLFPPFLLSPGCVAVPFPFFPSVSDPCFLNSM